jgi:hypothetical protein
MRGLQKYCKFATLTDNQLVMKVLTANMVQICAILVFSCAYG